MRNLVFTLSTLLWLIIGCGSGSDGTPTFPAGTGNEIANAESSGGQNNGVFMEVLEAACEQRCDLMLAPDCAASRATLSKTQCEYQCVISGEIIGSFCNDEYLAVVNCDVDGGFECVNDYVTSKSACMSEKLAHSDCAEDLSCKLNCQKLEDLGCGSGDVEGCVTDCNADIASYGECKNQYGNLVHCQQNWADACTSDGISLHNNCLNQVSKVASCLMDDGYWEICDAWCWLANYIGCSTGCVDQCTANHSDVTCGSAYEEMLDCGLFFDDIACVDGTLMAVDICESDWENWQECSGGE